MPDAITKTTTAVRAVVRHPRARTIAGSIMAMVGILVVLVEIGLHVYSTLTHAHYEMDHIVLLAGALIGFWGFYWTDSKSATGAVGVVVSSVSQIVRGGRRSTDAKVVVPKPDSEDGS